MNGRKKGITNVNLTIQKTVKKKQLDLHIWNDKKCQSANYFFAVESPGAFGFSLV